MRSPVVRTSALWCTSATAGRNVVADLLAAARIIRVILTIAPRNHDRPALITILKRRVSANLFSRRYPDLCPRPVAGPTWQVISLTSPTRVRCLGVLMGPNQ